MDKKLQNLLSAIKEAKEALERVEVKALAMSGQQPKDPIMALPDYVQGRVRVWVDVHEKGGVVSKGEFHQIGKKYGFDPRGLGGFFVGDASLVYLPEEKVALTNKAIKKLKEWGIL